ncbi:4-amino-4-deoxy-L-arabinose transferase-like glycosyltransferase [Chromobacterium alkanivorans]|uniref:ArnT family glycosyltransferase n=1 Tax=Chromobacterium alkanivorans TaxID=1071719 RepID=UPI0021686A9E|nr:glycosyltransferase family 39 protein [Chromobacterium alkanivorans]MCS3805007.1 4-amino-4-deoxy-L-arabinose transferase-like glycosyltransferase [Chromobacterium alkanivorans]MCS3819430.1 4-amino-4-deoxy-L-arabinose transferase-like glycosyltransferase [Chromobacterium alkanivorans]MCS3873942.1 4-amino-4-deoxy-L-arabinose transferase-like glycosyltransferase [Chromobacterium alkanivorans]
MKRTSLPRWQQGAVVVLLLLLLLRLVGMWAIPLTDTTEARYGEIARKMLETGNWVTLWHDYGIPFWAKPPLSSWLSAAGMGLFGVNEIAARLPSLLLAVATLGLSAHLMRKRSGGDAAMAAALILASGLLFLGAAGTVMTDPALLFCVTLSQAAFWHALTRGSRGWGYVFFVGLGLGLLAKGPLAIVLVGMPIFFWVLLRMQWLALWRKLPWISGTLLMFAVAAPWYALAELRTPGFLDYFIMGEHVSRFLDAGWKGDKYGFAHATPRGMIWLYALAAIFPWSLAMLAWLLRHGAKLPRLCRDDDGWQLYLALWTLMTLLFFTLSGNIIFPYSLPMLPGCALLFAELWRRARADGAERSALPWIAAVGGLLMLALLAFNHYDGNRYLRTQKQVIAAWQAQNPSKDSALVYWAGRREFSAEFYSHGRARATQDPQQLRAWLAGKPGSFIVSDENELARLPADVRARFAPLGRFQIMNDTVLLLGDAARAQPAQREDAQHD